MRHSSPADVAGEDGSLWIDRFGANSRPDPVRADDNVGLLYVSGFELDPGAILTLGDCDDPGPESKGVAADRVGEDRLQVSPMNAEHRPSLGELN
jgi:hypothetical protein